MPTQLFGSTYFQKSEHQLNGLKGTMTRAHFFASCAAEREKEINDDLELKNPIGD